MIWDTLKKAKQSRKMQNIMKYNMELEAVMIFISISKWLKCLARWKIDGCCDDNWSALSSSSCVSYSLSSLCDRLLVRWLSLYLFLFSWMTACLVLMTIQGCVQRRRGTLGDRAQSNKYSVVWHRRSCLSFCSYSCTFSVLSTIGNGKVAHHHKFIWKWI